MTNEKWRAWLGALTLGAAAAMPVRAGLVDFEDVTPILFSGPPPVSSGAFDFTSSGAGFSGVDTNSLLAFPFGNAPPNASGQFLYMLNADIMSMTRTDGQGFVLTSFDAAFIQPLGGLGGTASPGELHVRAEQTDGDSVSETFLFSGSDSDGNYNFAHFLAGTLGAEALKFAEFSACVYQLDASCSFDAFDIPPQFALDNLALTPEPGTIALALGGLGIIALRRRRRTA